MNSFRVGEVPIGEGGLTIIAGPCLAESWELCDQVATEMKGLCQELGFGYIFKASYDKANRTSAGTTRGAGIDAGLEILAQVKAKHGLPLTTDIHLPDQAAEVAKTVDLLQIPAFLCRQSDLLEAAAATGRPVNVKKGQFLAPQDTKNIVEKLAGFHAHGTMLTERGTSFGYNTLIVDMPGLEIMRSFGVPVCFDATHSAQRPGAGGTSSGGVRDSIPAMTRAAVAVGIDALFLEVHPDPACALSDAATQWPLARARELLEQVKAIVASASALPRRG
ncbi:3-deoxy-8-phosphooctulonate synthase [Fimbriimonas ginsengisoli]|uniref:3-deoxy-8-phosphooctulonate synthase n=1 Tax=Fimbriimonas ginsengisoli Gsoil 348 TaxID=661478 RepID=A0A068NXL5_FIMGI|nr:3-deoxy-8-phosphooctulonate synthase [Fimbriimonas ginsengisoli]AIE87500.1 2-dehydro-3-deoxyphosphooctonate aldolase [Fimbriimonas ginsengisoli Gsoil 348]